MLLGPFQRERECKYGIVKSQMLAVLEVEEGYRIGSGALEGKDELDSYETLSRNGTMGGFKPDV